MCTVSSRNVAMGKGMKVNLDRGSAPGEACAEETAVQLLMATYQYFQGNIFS